MDLRENLVVCIGSPMIDITARVPYDLLQKYNLKPNNATSFNQDCSKIFEDLEEYGPKFSIGGSITNTVISAQRILRSFHTFCYMGAIGKDDFGVKIRQTLESLGVNVLFEEINDQSTARCAVILFEDNRSFVTDLGASAFLNKGFIERNDVKGVINQAKYYYLSAFFLRISHGIIKKICEHANGKKKTFIFNIGAPFLCVQYRKELKEILPYVNVLIGNEEESKQLADALNYISKEIKDIALFLLNHCKATDNAVGDSLVIITRGSKSIVVANKRDITEFHILPLNMDMKLNTSGAGDYFVGGFLAKYIQSRPIQDCVQAGIDLCHKLIEENTLEIG